jgi:hypothetical protein
MSDEESSKVRKCHESDDVSVRAMQNKKNQRWGKMIRKSLGTEPQGKIQFEDQLKNVKMFQSNFENVAQSVPSTDANVTTYKMMDVAQIEALFKGDKPATEKKWSLSYGRQNIFSRLVPPLYISYDSSSSKIRFEGTYKASPHSQEIENYWHDTKRESLRASIKERLLAKPQNKDLVDFSKGLDTPQLPLLTLAI